MSDLLTDRPAATDAAPPRRPFLLLLPPWRQAMALGLRSPAAVVAVLVTTAILACAVASAPLFLSSARSAALQEQLAPQCAEAGWPGTAALFQFPPRTGEGEVGAAADRVRRGWADQGRTSEPALGVFQSIGSGGNRQRAMVVRTVAGEQLGLPANLLWRPGITEHVQAVAEPRGSGVWLPATYAREAGVRVGDAVDVSGGRVRVAGIYRDLWQTDPGPYWCDYRELFLNLASANVPPPALLLASDEQTAYQVAAGARFLTAAAKVPVPRNSLTATSAKRWTAEAHRALRPLRPDGFPVVGSEQDDRLGKAIERAERIENGLHGPVLPVAVAGGLLALLLVGAAGSFWADRRTAEVRLLASRGVGPAALAVKAALELAVPAAAGAVAGWATSRLLVGALGPADDLDPAATAAARWTGLAALVVGLACAAAVAGLRARGTAERPLGAAPRWPARVPWELALLVAAGWCWALLEGRPAIVDDHGVAQVNGLLVAFPLLGIAGAAVLATRLLLRLLPALRRFADRRRPAVFLAVNRLAAAPLAAGTLLVAVSLPAAVLGYTATLTASSRATLDAKAAVQIGAAHALVTVDRIDRTPATAAVGTVVDRYQAGVTPAGGSRTDAEILAVDPRTFARTAFWNDGFADRSLADLGAALSGPDVAGRVPVVAMGLPLGDPQLTIGSQPVPAEVVATARVLPGRRADAPLLLVSADRVPPISATANPGRVTELWTNGPVAPAIDAAVAAGSRTPRELDPGQVFTAANFLGITWTFGYLSALAVFVGVIAVGGLLLYLEARGRTRVSGYVMARRLGLSRGGHLASLVVELGGVAAAGLLVGGALATGAVSVVHRRLDVDPIRPPTPLLDVPWLAVALTAAVATAVAVLAAAYAQHAADRADPAAVLREDA